MSEDSTPVDEAPTSPPAETTDDPEGPQGGDAPVEPPPDTPDPPPEAPGPADTIAWEPRTWYEITYACLTPGCVNQNQERYAPMFYSNDGLLKNIRVYDSSCGKDCTILTATKLDPQPVEE